MHGGSTSQENGQSYSGSASATAAAARNSSSSQTPPPLQAKLRQHNAGKMTESILYTFLPSAMKAISGTAAEEEQQSEITYLNAEQATAVAAAALAVATLLNAPSGFLEFLLCLPWSQFTDMYATIGDAATASDASKMHLTTPTATEKSKLVNCQLKDERLLDCIMDFLYINDIDSTSNNSTVLPPLMCLGDNNIEYVSQNGAEAGKLQKAILVQLQGSTPLHCAAMRGNPVLVNTLLAAGADPLVKNGLGQVAMELVPKCSGTGSTTGSNNSTNSGNSSPRSPGVCLCVNRDGYHPETLECLSSTTRLTLIKKSLFPCTSSVWAWLHMCVLCLLCLFGFVGCPTMLLRPEVEARGHMCWEERKKKAQHKAQATVLKLRTEVMQGREELNYKSSGDKNRSLYNNETYYLENNTAAHLHHHCQNKDGSSCRGDNNSNAAVAVSRAYSHFSNAVNILKTIRLQQERHFSTSSSTTSSLPISFFSSSRLIPEAHFLPAADWSEVEVNEIELAAVYGGFAESALAMMEQCGCAGCIPTAGTAIHSAVKELMQLCSGTEPLAPSQAVAAASPNRKKKGSGMKRTLSPKIASSQQQHHQSSSSSSSIPNNNEKIIIAGYLATAVHAKGKFLLKTDVQQSPTRAAIWRAHQCVTEWSRLSSHFGIAAASSAVLSTSAGNGTKINNGTAAGENFEADDAMPLEIQCLDSWATSAASDVVLVEALLGTSLPITQSLSEAVPFALQYDITTGGPRLGRTVTKKQIVQLENALKQAKEHASDHIIALVEGVIKAAGEEIAAGERLRDLLVQRSSSSSSTTNSGYYVSGGPTADQLAAAIDAASKFPSLKEEVAQVELMRERWASRAAAQQQLDTAVESARSAPSSSIFTTNTNNTIVSSTSMISLNEEEFSQELNSRMELIESAIEAARQSSISVSRAKKVLTDLQAQGAAVEAGKGLEEALNGKRAGSAALKVKFGDFFFLIYF
jgi:hypothetical protein